jgi:hypothetical protein
VRRWPQALALLGLLAYLAVSLDHLAAFPPVGQDEPWIAAAPYKLATEGVFGSDLFTGYYRMERHQYEQMPLFPLAQAAIFRLFGIGVVQMRALPVACGLLLLVTVFAAGRQAEDNRVGALALVLMLVLRVAAGRDGTGILLLDSARINRYDIAVPVFGLLALLAFNRAERDRRDAWYVLTGLLTGLAGLAHLYGVFWLPIFAGLSIARRERDRQRQRILTLLLAGFALPWAPWAIYIATGWSDYLGQARTVAARFDLFNPRFYIDNVLHGDGPLSFDWAVRSLRAAPLIRVGTWTMVLGVPAAFAALVVAAYRQGRNVWSTLAVAALLQTLMFVALLKVKTIHYMIALWPLGALLLAWFGVFLWDRGRLALRISLLALLGLIVGEGVARVADARRTAKEATPYDWYEAEVASCIPPGSLVLGLQHYWLGLRQFPYRTWLLPIDLAHPQYSQESISFDQALERVNPAVILVDRHIDELMTKATAPDDPNHRLYVGFEAFKARRRATLTCVIRDRTYGTMQVYAVPPL